MRAYWHRLMHVLKPSLWENIDHLPVPTYAHLYRQQCRACGATRVSDLVDHD